MSDHTLPSSAVAPAISSTDVAGLLGLRDVAQAAAIPAITVERIDVAGYAAWGQAFNELCARAATPNPFMSPATVDAARLLISDDELVVLAARNMQAQGHPLVGIWAMRRTRDLWSLGIEVLQSPCVPRFDCLGTPVLDASMPGAAFDALISHVLKSNDLPRLIRVTSWLESMTPLLPGTTSIHRDERWSRAVLAPNEATDAESSLKASMGSGYKKRMAQERALTRAGAVRHEALRQDKALAAFGSFLALEQRGWKGKAGTALADVPDDAAYMQACLRSFARNDALCVDILRLDDEPIAIGIVVEAGMANIFWKTAFDETFAKNSPGVLLDMAVTRRLFAEGRPVLDSGMMEFTDPATQIWSGRMDMARAVIDLGAGLQGGLVRLGHRLRHRLRVLQRRFNR